MSAAAEDADDAIRIFTSRWKMAALVLPCFFVATVGLRGLWLEGIEHNLLVNVMLIAIGIGGGLILANMAFEREPVLTIDAEGVTCRRPPTGLIPWEAIAGLGMGKVSLLRKVLLIAVDTPATEPALAAKVDRFRASTLLNPAVSRFQGQFKGGAVIQVPISLLDVKAPELQRLLEERVHYAGD
ncbi:MAG: STM3941 family protein [Alphaproteobacteria bacterium]